MQARRAAAILPARLQAWHAFRSVYLKYRPQLSMMGQAETAGGT